MNGTSGRPQMDSFWQTAIADGPQRTGQLSASIGQPQRPLDGHPFWQSGGRSAHPFASCGGRRPRPPPSGHQTTRSSVQWTTNTPTVHQVDYRQGGRLWGRRMCPDVRRTLSWMSRCLTTLTWLSAPTVHQRDWLSIGGQRARMFVRTQGRLDVSRGCLGGRDFPSGRPK